MKYSEYNYFKDPNNDERNYMTDCIQVIEGMLRCESDLIARRGLKYR
jgi:hypothetical protein